MDQHRQKKNTRKVVCNNIFTNINDVKCDINEVSRRGISFCIFVFQRFYFNK